MPPFKVIIVGGGLAGCLLANGLQNNGVAVTVYERDTPDAKREGYQIRLGESALTGFRACLSHEHMARIMDKFGQSSGSTSTAPSLFNSRFERVLDLSSLPSYSRSWAINRVVLREILSEPLEGAGVMRYGKRFTHYQIDKDEGGCERVSVYFSDGSVDVCDLLVGADGSGSTVNKAVGLDNIVSINTRWAFLAKGSVPMSRLHELPPQLQTGPLIVFSGQRTFYYALYLPPKNDGRTNDGTKLEYDEEAASFYWGLSLPRSSSKDGNGSDITDNLQFCLDSIKDWAPEYHRLLLSGADQETTPDVHRVALRASKKPPKNWRERWLRQAHPTKGHPRVWLIGDAIHPMQPNRGMGGNQALHDCADILPQLLSLSKSAAAGPLSTSQIQTGCRDYEGPMFDRAFAWVSKSGGTAATNLNLDGFLGTLVWAVGKLVVPVLALSHWVSHRTA